jgi:hypothetical protein
VEQTYARFRLGERNILAIGGISVALALAAAVLVSVIASGWGADDPTSVEAARGAEPAAATTIDTFNQNPRMNPAVIATNEGAAALPDRDDFNQNPRMNPAPTTTGEEQTVSTDSRDDFNQNPRQR